MHISIPSLQGNCKGDQADVASIHGPGVDQITHANRDILHIIPRLIGLAEDEVRAEDV